MKEQFAEEVSILYKYDYNINGAVESAIYGMFQFYISTIITRSSSESSSFHVCFNSI